MIKWRGVQPCLEPLPGVATDSNKALRNPFEVSEAGERNGSESKQHSFTAWVLCHAEACGGSTVQSPRALNHAKRQIILGDAAFGGGQNNHLGLLFRRFEDTPLGLPGFHLPDIPSC